MALKNEYFTKNWIFFFLIIATIGLLSGCAFPPSDNINNPVVDEPTPTGPSEDPKDPELKNPDTSTNTTAPDPKEPDLKEPTTNNTESETPKAYLRIFYVSNSGDNSNDGLSSDKAWKTISKVNAEMSNFKPGDAILFKRGDIFNDATLNVSISGNADNPIVFGAYGTGLKPVFTSFKTLSNWTNEGNGIYSTYLSIEPMSVAEDSDFVRVMLTIDGDIYWMGRWPNEGYRTVNSVIGTNVFVDNNLTDDINYKNAEVVVRAEPWILSRRKILDHTGGTLTLKSMDTQTTVLNEGFGYFFQNDKRFLDVFGEWYYDVEEKKLYVYFGENPNRFKVEAATRNNLINIPGGVKYDYITFEYLSLKGANSNSIQRRSFIRTSHYLTFQNLDIDYSGANGIDLWEVHNSTIANNTISNSMESGIRGRPSHHTIVIHNNIKNSGLIRGTGVSRFMGINWRGTQSLIQYNHIDSSGDNGIFVGTSTGTEVRNNFINNSCLRVDDCGGIYMNSNFSNRVIDGNIVFNSQGDFEGSPYTASQAIGIFADDWAHGITITNNVMAYNQGAGMLLHRSSDCIIDGNLFFANHRRQLSLSGKIAGSIENVLFTNNILIGTNKAYPILNVRSAYLNPNYFKEVYNNYYLRQNDINKMFLTSEPQPRGSISYDFNEWKKYIGGDENSVAYVVDKDDLYFYYNIDLKNKTIILPAGGFKDVKGVSYSGSLTLQPYTAIVLIKN
jgi:parallel beta-helix repeat protein